MPIYVRRCVVCDHRFEELAKVEARNEIKCQVCNGATEGVPTAPRTERRFAGSGGMSRRYEFIPSEVKRMREVTRDSGARIDDTGHVWFDNRSQEQKFHGAVEKMSNPPPAQEEARAVDSGAAQG